MEEKSFLIIRLVLIGVCVVFLLVVGSALLQDPGDAEMKRQTIAMKQVEKEGYACRLQHPYFNHYLRIYSSDNETYQIYRNGERVWYMKGSYEDVHQDGFIGDVELNSDDFGSFYNQTIKIVKGSQEVESVFECYKYHAINLGGSS